MEERCPQPSPRTHLLVLSSLACAVFVVGTGCGRQPSGPRSAEARSSKPWEDVWRDYRLREHRAFTFDSSDIDIAYPLQKKWEFQDTGQPADTGGSIYRSVSYAAHDGDAVYAEGAGGRTYKIALADGRAVWQSEAARGAGPNVRLIGDSLVLPRMARDPERKGLDLLVMDTRTGHLVRTVTGKIPFERTLANGQFVIRILRGELPEDTADRIRARSLDAPVPAIGGNPADWTYEFARDIIEVRERVIFVARDGTFFRTFQPHALSRECTLFRHDAQRAELWSGALPPNSSIVALGDDDVILSSPETPLWCVSQSDGQKLWTMSGTEPVPGFALRNCVFVFSRYVVWWTTDVERRPTGTGGLREKHTHTLRWVARRTGEVMHTQSIEGSRPPMAEQMPIIAVGGYLIVHAPEGRIECYESVQPGQ